MAFARVRRPPAARLVLTTIVLAFAAVGALGAGGAAGAPAPAPAPIPAPAERAAAEKLVREVFAAELARRAPADQAAAAARFLAEAEKEQSDKAARYVLLETARDLAVTAADAALAWRAIDALGDAYQVDRAALRQDALAALSKSAHLTPRSAAAAAGHALAPVDALCDADDYAAAQRAVAQAEAFANRSRDAGLQASTRARAADVRSLAGQYERARPAIERLKTVPDDPDANLAAGSFYCFAKGDWAAGLPLLAKSSDPVLKDLAAADLAGPRAADARKALADRWWDAADAKAAAAAAWKPQMRRRAAAWYEQAAGELTGLARALARKRIAEAAADGAAGGRRSGAAAGKPSRRVVFILDASGSMMSVLKPAKVEIGKAIDELTPDQSFALIVTREDKPTAFAKGLVPADDATKKQAIAFLGPVLPASTGSLATALNLAAELRADVIWVVSDGDVSDAAADQAAAGKAVQASGCRINTTTLFAGKGSLDFLKRLAEENGGVCLDGGGKKLDATHPPPAGPSILREP